MSKKPIIGGIILAAIIGVVFVGAQINPDNPENEKSLNSEVWSTRIVGSEISSGGGVGVMTNLAGDTHTYSTIELERNIPYKFGFVPMGSSPNWIKISLSCNDLHPLNDAADCDVNFSELFILEGTLVDAGISEYHTWDYVGNKNFEISFDQCPNQKTCNYDITVERYGDLKGSVSISLSR